MSTDETTNGINEFVDNGPTEHTAEADVESTLTSSWNRRTFLKAAALGAAAAALVSKDSLGNLRFGAASALADNLSQFQCTANDVRILGAGQIINEPCNCPAGGTFTATVQFTVVNNAASDRGCITLHLCPAGGFNPGDVVLQGSIPGKTTQVMTATIPNYPCGTGLVCFGVAGQDDRGRCDTGTCCSTISWAVPGQDTCPPAKQISSKCRHQQICIQGRGGVTLDCNTATTGVQTNCAVPCGSTTTLQLCTTSSANLGPFTYTLNGQSFGPTPDTCHTFTVGPITQTSTTFTGTVTDASGCPKSASVTLTTTPVPAPTLVQTSANCAGVVVLTATAAGGNLSGGNTITLQPQLNNTCRTVTVTLTRGGCTSGATSYSFKQCVATTAC
jgi:hypothetical protein